MSWWVLFVVIVQVLLICAIIYFSVGLKKFNATIRSDLDSNQEQIQNFSAPVEFNAFPETIVVENPYECHPNKLHKCLLSDPTTCFGCQNLLAQCVHFERDTKWIPSEDNSTGEDIIIPANESPDEGYCLQTLTLVESCNLFHGDFVLVQTSPESQESQLICLCRNPGIIGNTSILGNCTTVLGCNGVVKDLNVPFEDVECECPTGMYSARNNDIPVCRHHTVNSYPNPDDLTFERETVSSSVFHPNISGNVKSSRLINPCLYDLFDGSPVNGRMLNVDGSHFCVSLDSDHVAIRRNPNGERLLRGDFGPDAVIKLNYEHINYYGELQTQMKPNLVAVFSTTKNPRLLQYGLMPNRTYAIDLTYHQDQIIIYFARNTTISHVPQGICEGNFPTYHCQYVNVSNFVGSVIEINYDIHMRQYSGRRPPPFFFANTGDWIQIETKLNPFLQFHYIFNPGSPTRIVLHMNPNFFSNAAQVERLKFVAFRFIPVEKQFSSTTMHVQLWRTTSFDDFNAVRLRYIPYPEPKPLITEVEYEETL